ncbi:unnamed protein product [Rangifer tarandus platyrhynchus]|uniref:Olfactory receptor n=1 Tax=Rangifer tarandus platyrhynchus TaxID=3082113 RepID=A0ABN8Z8S8_RANTA|nr:unnamed protein product [Rangifer tarandus platyrhynchus]
MDGTNESTQGNFILLGFSDRPHLERILFVVILIAYLLTLVGNTTIILVSRLDPHLHTPMYFFLTHLSFLDLSFTTSSIPQLLYNLNGHDKTISYTGCAIQLFLFLGLGGSECFLLAAMAYDRYVAVCHPLRYPILMNQKLCLHMTAGSWLLGGVDGLMQSGVTLSFPYCHPREINHFFCEAPSLVRLACTDTMIFEFFMYVCCVLMLLIPVSFILASYGLILITVLRMHSAAARKKTFATCSSHLAVVGVFYGTIIFIYMRPKSYRSVAHDKIVSAFYTIFTPVLNPLIYSLRNSEVKGALRKCMDQCAALSHD